MRIFQKYQKHNKDKAVATLLELVKRIKSGHLIVMEMGFWDSGIDSSVFLKIKLLSRDSKKEIKHFQDI